MVVEEQTSYSDHRAALFKRDVVIPRHAHAQDVKIRIPGKKRGFELGEVAMQLAHLGVDLVPVFRKRGHPHHTPQPHARQCLMVTSRQEMDKVLKGPAKLAFLPGHLNLQQAFHDLSNPSSLFMEGFPKVDPIQGVYHPDPGQELPDFIGLQVANEVPSNVPGEQGRFGNQLLNPVFGKNALAKGIDLQDLFDGARLADGNHYGVPGLAGFLQDFIGMSVFRHLVVLGGHNSVGHSGP